MSRIQSILFDKSQRTIIQASSWLFKNNFKFLKIDETSKYYRFRQFNPNPKKSYRTIELTKGIKAIVEV